MTFKEKVQSMSAGEIIMAMVNGLKKEHVTINMSSFGMVRDGICYGCAATNAICEIHGKPFDTTSIWSQLSRASFVNTDVEFLCDFEAAIDWLKESRLKYYNKLAERNGFATINTLDHGLPVLGNDFTALELEEYVKLAEIQ